MKGNIVFLRVPRKLRDDVLDMRNFYFCVVFVCSITCINLPIYPIESKVALVFNPYYNHNLPSTLVMSNGIEGETYLTHHYAMQMTRW
jgi:hypothetical protein